MNAQIEKTIRQRIAQIIEDQKMDQPKYGARLREKGVEYAILMPIFEHILGFDPLEDIEYELTSAEKHGQRFDFLLDRRIIVETKALALPLTSDTVNQIAGYILGNEAINYGILSNGWQFSFLIRRSFIEKVANQGETIVGATHSVYSVLSLTIDDPHFFEIIALFSKSSYDETFRSIAKYVFRQLVPTKGPTSAIVADKKLDEYIKNLIVERMQFKKGHYLDQIRKGTIKPGDKLHYDDGNVRIEIAVQPDGTVLLPKNSILVRDMNAILSDGTFKPLLALVVNQWCNEDQVFDDPRDIFRMAIGKQKLYGEKFQFRQG